MSFDALAWAAKCRPGSPAKKLVLLALAECAQRESCTAFPSIAAISEFTELNRKTIIGALDDLEKDGFITDTGEKIGRTGQVKIYFLNLETVPKTVLFKQSQKRNSSKSGTLSKTVKKQPLKTVPKTEQYQKRDTEPVYIKDIDNKGAKRASKVAKPAGVSEEVWADFNALRERKKAPLTTTAFNMIVKEVELAGWPLEQALSECIMRGWQAFKASWVANQPKPSPAGYDPFFAKYANYGK